MPAIGPCISCDQRNTHRITCAAIMTMIETTITITIMDTATIDTTTVKSL